MATAFPDPRLMEVQSTQSETSSNAQKPDVEFPPWYCPETGIYKSKNSSIQLPTDPFLDVVSHIFSHPHNGQFALIDSSTGFSISYSQLPPLVTSMASGLQEMGISKGDVVLFLLPNSIYFPIILLGTMYVGGIVTPMNPLSSFSEVKQQTDGVHISLAFCIPEYAEKLKALGIKAVEVPVDAKPITEMPESSAFRKLISTNPTSISRPRISQDDIAAVMSSSGTTGASKGVLLTHRNFIATVELFIRFEASQYNDQISWRNVYLASVPMFHVYGLALFALGLFSLGTCVVVMRRFDPGEVVKAIDKYKVTHLPVVPPMLKALTVKTKGGGHGSGDVRSLKQVSCGAAWTSRKCIDEFVRALPHVDFIQGYGMTETAAVGTRGLNTETSRKYDSVGLLAPNMEARVVDWNNTSLHMAPGRAGELWLKGPGNMKGYLHDQQSTMLTIDEDGWLRTGDIVHFDDDGYLYILDRLKDIIKYKGFQVAPADLETVLLSHPEVADAAVTGAADEEAGEVPVAFIVKRPGSMVSEDEIIKYTAKQVAPYKKVRRVVFVNSIPRSPAGKVLRRQLRNSLASKL